MLGEADALLELPHSGRRDPRPPPCITEELHEGFPVRRRDGSALERLADHKRRRAVGPAHLDAVVRVHGREDRAVGRDVPHGLRLEHADLHRAALHPERLAGGDHGERVAGPVRAARDDRRLRRGLGLRLAGEGEAHELMRHPPVRRHRPCDRDPLCHREREAACLLPAGQEPVHALEHDVRDQHGVPSDDEQRPRARAELAGARAASAHRPQQRALCVENTDLLRLLVQHVDPSIRVRVDPRDVAELVLGVALGHADPQLLDDGPRLPRPPHADGRVLHDRDASAVPHRPGPLRRARRPTARSEGRGGEGGQDQGRRSLHRVHSLSRGTSPASGAPDTGHSAGLRAQMLPVRAHPAQ